MEVVLALRGQDLRRAPHSGHAMLWLSSDKKWTYHQMESRTVHTLAFPLSLINKVGAPSHYINIKEVNVNIMWESMYGVCCVWFQFVFIFVFVDSSQVAETKSWGRKIDLLCGWKDTAESGKIVVQSFFSLSKPDRVAAIWNCPRGIHTLCFFSFMHICNDVCWQPRWEGLDANNTFVFPAESYFTGTHKH